MDVNDNSIYTIDSQLVLEFEFEFEFDFGIFIFKSS